VFLCFFVFSWFSAFSSFFCFSLMRAILVIIKVNDAARRDQSFAKVFVSNSLCYCEVLVSGPHLVCSWHPQEAIKYRTSRPGRPTSKTHFVFGIERPASTERHIPGEAFSFVEKIGDPSRPENQDFRGFAAPKKIVAWGP